MSRPFSLNRPVARAVARSAAWSATGAGGDPDAIAYASAISAQGASVSTSQISDLSAFVSAEKSAGRWPDHKRILLPIWGLAAANSICLKTLAAGSWFGGITHASGYIQGNGSTGYFDFGVSAAGLGQTVSSSSLSCICTQSDSRVDQRVILNSYVSSTQYSELQHNSSTQVRFNANDSLTGQVTYTLARASQVGILIGTREGGSRRILQRTTAAFSTIGSTAAADSGLIPSGNFKALRSDFGVGVAYSDGRYGAFHIGMGLSVASAEAFSLNLKTLWENLTGLTLP
jgi:hypothetical protein